MSSLRDRPQDNASFPGIAVRYVTRSWQTDFFRLRNPLKGLAVQHDFADEPGVMLQIHRARTVRSHVELLAIARLMVLAGNRMRREKR